MKNNGFPPISLLILIFAVSLLLAGCSSGNTSNAGPLDGQTLMQQRCTVCHDIEPIASIRGNSQEWNMVVVDMIRRGAKLNTEEKQTLVDYLAQTYP